MINIHKFWLVMVERLQVKAVVPINQVLWGRRRSLELKRASITHCLNILTVQDLILNFSHHQFSSVLKKQRYNFLFWDTQFFYLRSSFHKEIRKWEIHVHADADMQLFPVEVGRLFWFKIHVLGDLSWNLIKLGNIIHRHLFIPLIELW